jgi:demethylmenaquinone methyltransferase/2-methoxy-6-polyprenyl-1,4-benzoquinol methylase/phosphoethanolamine N-methyltransferase
VLTSVMLLGRRAQLRQETVALAAIQPGDHVLEVGCGTGDVALTAQARVGGDGAVAGIDPAPEMIVVAQRKAQRLGRPVTFQLGVVEALPFPDQRFDVVLSSLMMHHLPGDLKRDGLAEIARVLKPGGRLVIVDIKPARSRWERITNALMMHAHLGGVDLAPLVRAAGFTAVESGATCVRPLGFTRATKPAGQRP